MPGDTVCLSVGDRVPADLRLFEVYFLFWVCVGKIMGLVFGEQFVLYLPIAHNIFEDILG